MAWNKEATVIVFDIGSHMAQQAEGKMSHFDISKQCILRILQNKLFTESKDEFALVLCGAENTDNRLNEMSDSDYMSIKTEAGLKMVDWEILDALSSIQEPTMVKDGDVFEALRVALDVIEQEEAASKKKRFAKRRILLFSNLRGTSNAVRDQMSRFVQDMESANINMMQLIGVDLEEKKDEPRHNGHDKKGQTKKQGKAAVETLQKVYESLKSVEDVESYSFADALKYTNAFAGRQVRPTPWNGLLEIGETLKVPVVMFCRIKEAKPKQSWKKAYAADPSIGIQQSTQFFRQVGLQREEVAAEELVEAYRYGVTTVPFSEEDKKNMKFTNVGKCMKALGFAPASQVKAHLFVGDDVKIMTAALADEAAATAVSALVHALKEDNMVIICKYGYNRISAPKMVALSPHICQRAAGKYEGFYVHYLPFEDDLRLYTFAPLVNNKRKIHLQPNEEQLEAVGDLIDKLTVNEGDDYFDALNPKNIRNPYLQRLYQSLQHRALNADKPLPPLDEGLLTQLTMPKELAMASAAEVDRIKLLFPLKKVEKPKFRRQHNGAAGDQQEDVDMATIDGTDGGSAALGQINNFKPTVVTVGTIAPVDDFMTLIEDASDTKFDDAVKKAAEVVNEIIFGFDGSLYAEKVLKLITVVRRECVTKNRTFMFNMFLKTFKADLQSKDLKDVWEKLVEEKVTLIDSQEASESNVSRKEAEEFLKVTAVKKASPKKAAAKKDEDDMFSEMFA
ncbi:Ku80 [Ramazzottius varieornatus]|uniref:Ku80 n=1 Tax=Ramazzottius varieornatus TaxID=947166 RepID=A0A1D1VPX3_RAMVA|nr:Ku80 [Ramazzottius varieornatus]